VSCNRATPFSRAQKLREDTLHILVAALVAPLSILVAVPVGAAVVALLSGAALEAGGVVAFSGLLLVFAYPWMFLIGVPSYLVLRRLNLASIWSAALVGFVAAEIVPVFLLLVQALDLKSHGFAPEIAYGNLEAYRALSSVLVSPLMLLGPLVAIAFWLLLNGVRSASNRRTP
jgi:hypothetical protein